MANKGTWKIKIASVDFALYTDSVKADPVSGGPIIQEEPLAGGAAPAYFDRGNKTIKRHFIVVKEWPDNKQSWVWYQIGGPAVAGVATVVLYHMDYTGAESSVTITNAKVEVSIEEPIGPTTITHLVITGGAAVLNP